MVIEEKIKIYKYKCFDTDGAGFDRILPINIIIGKNNSGKSSLLDLVRFRSLTFKKRSETDTVEASTFISIEKTLTIEDISRVFEKNSSQGGIPANNHFEYGRRFEGKIFRYQISADNNMTFESLDADFVEPARSYLEQLAKVIDNPLANKDFCQIAAERDIKPEMASGNVVWDSNGSGATNTIQQIINNTKQNSSLIETELLNELNKIIQPDISFKRILVQIDDKNYWQIYFEDEKQNRVALSKMGSGVKTVLLVLLDLIVLPTIDKSNKSNYIYAFEELENNLHPALQRRLYNYIENYSKKYSAYFFLTTHSNVVIDSFGLSPNAQIVHVINQENISITKTVSSNSETKAILKDLDIKASDLLQSNGIIWVEGPSDRYYINKWLSILAPELKEGLHYSIMFYGGKLLSHLCLDYEWFNTEIIPLLKINTNAFILMDKDGKTINSKLNDTKVRISSEIGEDNCWITQGREIENYLSDEVIQKWLSIRHEHKTNFQNEKNTKLEDSIIKCDSKIKIIYNQNKTLYSSEIVEYIDKESLKVLDLSDKLNLLVSKIKIWNSIT
jgi:predicted ATP-dependent endonuclease of OLD family